MARVAFGRGAEVREVEAALEDVVRSRRRVLLITGESGIGKTTLLDHALDHADARGVPSVRCRANEFESRRPFAAIADCLGITPTATEPQRRGLASLLLGEMHEPLESLDGSAGSTAEFAIVDAIVTLVVDMCSDRGFVLALDDLQWADPATVAVLHRLSRTAADIQLLLCATYRPAPRSPELARFLEAVGANGATTLALQPLGPTAVGELLTSLLERPPGPRLLDLATTAAGNPFYVTELVASLRASGSIAGTATTADIGEVAAPSARRLTVLLEISFLPTTTQQLLRTASVLGTTFTVEDLARVVGRSPVALLADLTAAMASGVLHEEGARLAFRHHLVREALYDDIPASLRKAMHLDIGANLARAGASAVDVAEHFLRGASRGDAMALEWLTRAAGEVTMRAPAIAADVLERAIQLYDQDDPMRDLVVADLALCLHHAGRVSLAEAVCTEALRHPLRPQAEGRVRLCLAGLLSGRGLLDEALHHVALAQDVAGLTASQRARLVASASALPAVHGRVELAESMARDGLRLRSAATPSPTPPAPTRSLWWRSTAVSSAIPSSGRRCPAWPATTSRRRAAGRARALGLSRSERRRPPRPKVGWDALTRSERAVVELVAQGLSNVEVAKHLFLSHHTVKRHPANAMLKLGEKSRRALWGAFPPAG